MIRRDFLAAGPAAATTLGLLAACGRDPPPLAHDFYVWQRAWKDPLDQALTEAAPDVRAWRILGLHLQATGPALASGVRLETLRAIGRLDEVELPVQIQALLRRWTAHGLRVEGLEIDHDCPTARLAAYMQWLARLRARLPGTRLSITALPTWLQARELPGLLAAADEAVLQVHAVQRPSGGLFDNASARRWTEAFAALSPHPFRIALPCYSSRAGFNEWGELVAVESETPVGLRSRQERELSASPHQVAALLAWLRETSLAGLAGAVWFRLPTLSDQRAWRLATWRAVVRHRALPRTPLAYLRETGEPGLFDVVIDNASPVDVDLPASVGLPARCVADGRQGYALDLLSGPPRLVRRQAGWLRPGRALAIGWVRCTQRMDDVFLPTQVS